LARGDRSGRLIFLGDWGRRKIHHEFETESGCVTVAKPPPISILFFSRKKNYCNLCGRAYQNLFSFDVDALFPGDTRCDV
jgi:hypothetical protein